MLFACRLAGLSALETHYAGIVVATQFWMVAKAPRLFAHARLDLRGSPMPLSPEGRPRASYPVGPITLATSSGQNLQLEPGPEIGLRWNAASEDRFYVVTVRIENEGGVVARRITFSDVANSGRAVVCAARS